MLYCYHRHVHHKDRLSCMLYHRHLPTLHTTIFPSIAPRICSWLGNYYLTLIPNYICQISLAVLFIFSLHVRPSYKICCSQKFGVPTACWYTLLLFIVKLSYMICWLLFSPCLLWLCLQMNDFFALFAIPSVEIYWLFFWVIVKLCYLISYIRTIKHVDGYSTWRAGVS